MDYLIISYPSPILGYEITPDGERMEEINMSKFSKESKVTVVPDSFEYYKEDYSKQDSSFSALSKIDVERMRERATTHNHWLFLCRIESGSNFDKAISMAIKTSNGFGDLESMYMIFNDYSDARDIILDNMRVMKMTSDNQKTYQKFVDQRVAYKKKCLAKKKARLAREDKESSCLTSDFIRSTYGIGTVAE